MLLHGRGLHQFVSSPTVSAVPYGLVGNRAYLDARIFRHNIDEYGRVGDTVAC